MRQCYGSLVWIVCASLGIAGCRNDSAPDCDGLSRSQTLAEPCCASYGVDACGAHLFCAAFDGRAQTTCYAERSRPDQAQCYEDGHCLSGSCNQTTSQCRSSPGATCSAEAGCADLEGNRSFCLDGSCAPVGDGSAAALCETDADCDSGSCGLDSRCAGASLSPCDFNADCPPTERCECDSECLCHTGTRGTGQSGIDACVTGNDCETSLCVEGAGGVYYCSGPCTTETDCGPQLPQCVPIYGLGTICIR